MNRAWPEPPGPVHQKLGPSPARPTHPNGLKAWNRPTGPGPGPNSNGPGRFQVGPAQFSPSLPKPGCVKINVDAMVNSRQGIRSSGMLAHDENAEFLPRRSGIKYAEWTTKE
ncbi:unnamed protein product [Cuscuta europaea]|uniref:Uncharacterized protein n=1 Tax=Cuscuta europaea TaxID=41803 RepID=A0A9P0ZS58_CUSEU|nr:unnamed protein product [Cuscuta europaea]